MRVLIRVLKALADPTRMRILKLLERKKMCVCELTAVIGIRQSSISHHLKILRDAGLVDDIRNGLWIDYQLTKTHYNQYSPDLLEKIPEWLNDDETVLNDLKEAKKTERAKVCK
jgi:ArsR family transcriptional regulator